MKYSLTVFFLVATSFSLWGQRIRFCDTTNTWRMLKVDRGSVGEREYGVELRHIGSKFANGHQYAEIAEVYTTGPQRSQFFREDTVAGKVFQLTSDSTEVLLYDYNLKLWDTIFNPANATPSRVMDIDSTQIDHQWYKVWYFEAGTDGRFNYHVVEGLGCLQGMALPVNASLQFSYVLTNSFTQLWCFTNKGMADPLSHPVSVVYEDVPAHSYIFDNANGCTLGVDQVAPNLAQPYVAPNPADESGRIILPARMSGVVRVVSAMGLEVMEMPITQKEEILIGPGVATPGIYYYRIIDNSAGAIYTGTFVKR